MRIWDIPPSHLCKNHLLGEHRELHAIWSVITQSRKGYSLHPETQRWKGKLAALYDRHQELVSELHNRGYKHNSELQKDLATGLKVQTNYVHSVNEQLEILSLKKCQCRIESVTTNKIPTSTAGKESGRAIHFL